MKRRVFGAIAPCLLLVMQSQAQPPTPPQTYSFTATSVVSGPSTLTVNRNGSKERIEIVSASGDIDLRVLYDFQAHRIYTVDIKNKSCTTQEYASAYAPQSWDPIGDAAAYAKEIGALPKIRREAVNGIPANLVEAPLPEGQGKARYWLEEKFGFPVKVSYAMGKDPERTMLEMRQISYAPSAAGLFTAPAACTRVGGVSTATGGHAEMSVDASATGEASMSGGAAATKPAAPAGDPNRLLGQWDFTGKDGAGVQWTGTLSIEKVDPDRFDLSKYSNVCDLSVSSANSGKGVSGPCLYDPQTKALSFANGQGARAYSLTATLSPDGKSLTQGQWIQGGAAAGSWSAVSSAGATPGR